MEREFSLEAILTATTGVSCVDDFDDFLELVWFAFDDTGINTVGSLAIIKALKDHLLYLYPKLEEAQPIGDINEWVKQQKVKYGETLLVCPMGQTLSDNGLKTKSR